MLAKLFNFDEKWRLKMDRRRKFVWIRVAFALFVAMNVFDTRAEDFLYVPDMSKVTWQMAPDGTVYFRNLNVFDSSFLAGNYNYSINTTTPQGKAGWSAILLKMASAQPLYLGFANKSQGGSITYFGNW